MNDMKNIINLKGLIIIVIIIGIIIGICYGFSSYEDLFKSNEKFDFLESKVIAETKTVAETKIPEVLEVLENKNSLTNEVINNDNTALVKEQKIYSKKKKIMLICGITTGIICTGVAAYCFIPAVAPLVHATASAALELATTTDFSSLPGFLGSILASCFSSGPSGNFSNENLPSTGPTVTFYNTNNTNNTNNINNINTTISPLNYELPDLVEEEVTRVPTPPAEPISTQTQPQPPLAEPTPTHSPSSSSSSNSFNSSNSFTSSNSNSQLRFSGLNRYSSYSRVPLLFTTRSPVVEQPVISLETMGILPEDTSSN